MNSVLIWRTLVSKTALPWVVFFVGIGIAVAAGLWSKNELDKEVAQALDRTTQQLAFDITQRFTKANYGLNSVRALYATREQVSRKEFEAFVASRNLPKEFLGMRGFGFIERVQPSELNAFIATERADGNPLFSIRQLDDKTQAELFVIKLIAPAKDNDDALGLNVGSEPRRRAALQRAIDTGEATMTEAISLVQDKRQTPGVLFFVPIYKMGTNPGTVSERRAALLGLAFAPIVFHEALQSIPDFLTQQVNFEIVSSGETTAEKYYDSDHPIAKLGDAHVAKPVSLYAATQALPLFGQDLRLRISSLPAFDASFDRSKPWLIFALLALLSTLTALLLRMQTGGLHRAELLAKQMTESLRREEARWRNFSTSASDWFWETDAQHTYFFISENVEAFYGLPATQLVGRNFRDLLAGNTLNAPELMAEQLSKLDAHQPLRHFEYRVEVAGGNVRWIVMSAVPQFDLDGRFSGYLGNGSCITERKVQELETKRLIDEISSLNQRLSLATDSAQIGVWDYNVIEDTLEWSKWMYALYGVRQEDFSGAMSAWRAGLHPDDLPRGDADLAQALSGEKEFNIEFRVILPSGEVRHIKAAALVLRDAAGAPVRMTGINYDITLIKNSEQRLKNALRAAESATNAKTDFLANMSHEIRSPLNAILGLAYLLEQSKLEHDEQSTVRKIRASGRLLLSLINNILDMSKIEAGQIMIEQVPYRLADVVDNAAVALGVAVGEKDIEIVMSPLPAGVSSLLGDALRVEQVLINLISNAVKFTEVGSIEVRAEVVGDASLPHMLRFAVKDTGIGIPPELHTRVFSAFAQADTSTTRRFGGTGLGLSICRQLVSLMGGEIGVISTPGVGSEFWFTLPLQHAADPDSVSPSMASVRELTADGLAGLRVLVVDDSDINRDVAQRILVGQGAAVALAEDGQQALDWLLAHATEVDIVLMDVQMPVMDGMEATRRLRRLHQFDGLPIVALTAGAFKSQHEEALAAGMTHFVSKPFDVPSTVALIQRLCRPMQPSLPSFGTATLSAAVAGVASAPTVHGAMDIAQGLALWSDAPTYQTYLRRFVNDYSDVAVILQASLARGDRASAAALSHKLAGVAANLALPHTQQAAQALEHILATQVDSTVALGQLGNALVSAVAEIHRYAPPANDANDANDATRAAAKAPWAPLGLTDDQQHALKPKLTSLLAALYCDNTMPAKACLATLAHHLPSEALSAIWASVLGYDFRGAEDHTQQLAKQLRINLWE